MAAITQLCRLWFGLQAAVSRRAYVISGTALMALKLAIDQSLAFASTGKPWPLGAYLIPSVSLKSEALRQGSSALSPTSTWTLAVMAMMALPFLWIGVTMTVRRAADAGVSPWWGLLFFIPLINYLVMLVFAILPAAKQEQGWVPVTLGPFRTRAAGDDAHATSESPVPAGIVSALLGVLLSVVVGLGMTGLSVYSLNMYGAALFFATPFAMGLTTALTYNAKLTRTLTTTLGFTILSVALTGATIMTFALEGAVCLAMAFPIACAIALLGALLGYGLAKQAKNKVASYSLFLILPMLAGVESKTATAQLREVTTAIEIDATPDVVFQHVTSFSELPAAPDWFFKLGIAYPIRARIVGEGVGAIRYCEFSTGPFIEPITVWEPGKRLGFDVTSQPPSMKEWSPYAHVNAPHLEGYMVSKRGEFRLLALPGNRTRLEGSTFYTLSIYPEAYWVPWGEALLHRIHSRVLTHVKHLSELPRSRPVTKT